jgi:hypothetical protein
MRSLLDQQLWFCLVSTLITFQAFAQSPCACDSMSNRDILTQVQNESGGAAWFEFARFNISQSVCDWFGVTCIGQDVTAWTVGYDIGMTALPNSVVNLTFLQTLVIRNQISLSGTLPSSWRGLKQITKLVIAYSSNLTGVLTEWVGHELITLTDLRLVGLSLSGSLPPALFNLVNMTYLLLRSCRFTGSIPDEWSQFQRLQFLYVNNNLLTGTIPSWIPQLAALNSISIEDNNITGTIPEDMNVNGMLQMMNAGRTLLHGMVPNALTAAPMSYLDLSSCFFSGPLPSSTNQSTMIVLLLNGNDFSGTLPSSWAQMTLLNQLNISNQQRDELCGGVPLSWSNISALPNVASSISAAVNKTCPSVTKDFSISMSLCPCDTDKFRIPLLILYESTGGPVYWSPIFRFEEAQSLCSWYGVSCVTSIGEGIGGFALSVVLNSVGMNGTLPGRFAEIGAGLEVFAIYSEHNLVGSIPDSWSRLVGLRQFTMVDNQLLSGSIPTWSWPHLENIQLSTMPLFSGTIPSELATLSNLSYIYLTSCNFSGTIPSALGRLRHLQGLYLGNNLLTGEAFPDEFLNLKSLRVYGINNCPVSGSIPKWFSSLSSLTSFHGYGTQISGTLPKHLPPTLIVIQLGYSLVEGTLPLSWPITNPNLRRSWLFQNDSSKPHLCGGIPQSWLNWRNDSAFTIFTLNEALVDTPCPPQNQSYSFSHTASNSVCSNSMMIGVSRTFRNCSSEMAACIWMSSISPVRVSETVFVVTSSVAYDAIALQQTSTIQVPLSTDFSSAAGGASWPINQASESFGRVSFPPDSPVCLITFTAPTPTGWPIKLSPYVTQVLHVGNVSVQCATTINLILFEISVTPRSLPQIASAVSATSTVAAWGSAVSGSGSAASTTARVAAVQKLLLCIDDDAGSGGGLLGLAVGNDRLSSSRGAIAGNIIVVVTAAVAVLALGWTSAFFARAQLLKMLERMHAISLLFPIFVATLPSSIAGIVRIFSVATTRDELAWALAFIGLMCWGGLLCALVWISWSLPQHIQTASPAQKIYKPHSVFKALERHTVWVDINKGAGVSSVTAFHVILREYRVLWYPASEAFLGAVSGAATAATAGNDTHFCENVSATLCAAYIVHLVITVWCSPFTTKFGLIYAALVGTLSAMCVGFQIVFSIDDSALWAVRASTGSAMAILGISYFRTLMDCLALLRGVNLLRIDVLRDREVRLADSANILNVYEMDQLHEVNSQFLMIPSATSSPPSFALPNISQSSSFAFQPNLSESSLRLSVVEAEFWDSDGNARNCQSESEVVDVQLPFSIIQREHF